MFVPEFFFGKFSDVERKFKSLRSRAKTLESVQAIYNKINENITDDICHDDFVISLSDDYLGRKIANAYYPFVFSNYIAFEENENSDIARWFKEKSLDCKWCQLSALATNSLMQFWYDDKEYAQKLGDSVCFHWNFYMSFGERFCFMPLFEKNNNRYFFWEHNIALSKLLFSITGEDIVTVEELENFPHIWQEYTKK